MKDKKKNAKSSYVVFCMKLLLFKFKDSLVVYDAE